MCAGEAKAQIVVPVLRGVVVAISRTAVPRVVVPAAATIDPVRASFRCLPLFLKHTPNLFSLRQPLISDIGAR